MDSYVLRGNYGSNYNNVLDANNMTEVGYYSALGVQKNAINIPTGENPKNFEIFVLSSCADGKAGVQIFRTFNGTLYYRAHWGTYWSNWITINKELNDNSFMGLNNFICIGDSLSVSLSYKDSSTSATVKSWAKHLANRMNVETSIFAHGGYTVNNFINSDMYQEAINNNYQFAIIYLGTNDVNNSTNIDTFKNDYKTLINSMLINHKFVLCLSLMPTTSGENRDTYNNVIKEVCNEINKAFYCDTTKYDYFISHYRNWGHLSAVGYAALATAVSYAISDTLKGNTYFQYGLDF